MTTISGAKAAALGIAALRKSGYGVKTLAGIPLSPSLNLVQETPATKNRRCIGEPVVLSNGM